MYIYIYITIYPEIINYTDLFLFIQRLYNIQTLSRLHKIQISHCLSRDYIGKQIYRYRSTDYFL